MVSSILVAFWVLAGSVTVSDSATGIIFSFFCGSAIFSASTGLLFDSTREGLVNSDGASWALTVGISVWARGALITRSEFGENKA